ncbi:ATP-dependent RNA helicase DDX19A-like [Halichondria panicea]|uniref:ATP-dependent RNA helicase DDX19A-like n=1 Tax=Halichondria panicea TaxID=6063 RepID=UPI00312BAA2C
MSGADDVDWVAAMEEQEQRQLREKLSESLKLKDKPAASEAEPGSKEAEPENKAEPGSTAEAAASPDTGDTQTSVAEASLLTKVLRTRIVDNVHDVEVQQKDPNSPLYSVKSFEELRLRPELLKGVYGLGFNRPSKIQEKALPLLLADPPENLIAQSQSGTGKTAAFVLSMLSRVNPSLKHPQVVCLSPTFDLAQQTGNVLSQMAKFSTDVKMVYAVRGVRVERGTTLKEQIIMGTSGTVLDWILKKKAIDPTKIKMFVLDEADVMIDQQGQQDQTVRIQKLLPDSCQKVLFSATYSDEVMKFAKRVIPDPVIIRLKRAEESLNNIKQFYVECRDQDEKFSALSNLYGVVSIGQSMIFCHTRKSAEALAGRMSREGHNVALITGDSTTDQRIAVLNRFRDGKEKMLITTNLCARGIDVEQVTLVVNYDIPIDVNKRPDCETYLHRIGRTGRFGRSGIAINFVDGSRSMGNLRTIESHFGRKIEKLDINDPDQIEAATQEDNP